ncbi:hypothetical protein, partial [Streptomyces toxytricini]
MTIKDVARHDVAEEQIDETLRCGVRRAIGHWFAMRDNGRPLRLRRMGGDLLDLAGARTLEDPALDTESSREVLLTTAECALGELSLGCFLDGDFEVPLPLVDETLTSAEMHYDETWEPASPATTAQTWVKAFALCVISGLVWERSRVIGPLLREDYAPAIRDGVPYSKRESVSTPADLAEMDVPCEYLTIVQGRYPGALPGPARWQSPTPKRGSAPPNGSTRPAPWTRTSGCCASCSTTISPPSIGAPCGCGRRPGAANPVAGQGRRSGRARLSRARMAARHQVG